MVSYWIYQVYLKCICLLTHCEIDCWDRYKNCWETEIFEIFTINFLICYLATKLLYHDGQTEYVIHELMICQGEMQAIICLFKYTVSLKSDCNTCI